MPVPPHTGRAAVRRVALARVISFAGSLAAEIALLYSIYDRTGSEVWVSAALLASVGVTSVASPLAGLVADRFDRRRVMIASDVAGAAAFCLLALADEPGALVAFALLAAAAEAPFMPASNAAIPNLVGGRDLGWANSLLASSTNAALLFGPVAGGALVAAVGPSTTFLLNAASFLASAAVLVGTRGRFSVHRDRQPDDHLHGMGAGFRIVARDPVLRLLACVVALVWASFGIALVADVPLAASFDAGSIGYSLLTAVWGAGQLAGSWTAGRVLTPAREPPLLVVGAVLMGVAMAAIVVLPSFAAIVAVGSVGGFGGGLIQAPRYGIVQRRAGDAVRGRVLAAGDAVQQGAFAVALAAAGPAVAVLGAQGAYAVPAVLLAVAALAAAALVRAAAPSAVGIAPRLDAPD